ncbi:MAG TPA: hypothetical protein VFX15_02985 [Actinomycetes bacterium]|nr:hypothetical protein [Actinomycetes bacterium]
MDASDYFENAILNWFRGTAFPAATGSVWVAAFITATTDAGGGTEVSGGSYARVEIPKASGEWSAPSGGTINQVDDVVFPTATANWGTITHIALFDASSGGNMLVHGALNASRTINSGDTLRLPSGELSLAAA